MHPDLGTFADFDPVAAAADRGLGSRWTSRCSVPPTTHWVTDHPEWFAHPTDGTIAYAENPPKKLPGHLPAVRRRQDGLFAEVLRVVHHWVDRSGVRIFRRRQPAHPSVEFWRWPIADVAKDHPEVIWLAEYFTAGATMQ